MNPRHCQRFFYFLSFLMAIGLLGEGASARGQAFSFGEPPTPISVKAQFTTPAGGQPARLFVTATMEPTWHIYSITQEGVGPVRTQIKLDPSTAYKVVGDFVADPPPEKTTDQVAFPGVVLENHHGSVTWHAPIELAAGVDPSKLTISGNVFAQACTSNTCLRPQDYPFTANLGPGVKVAVTGQQPPTVPVTPTPPESQNNGEQVAQPPEAPNRVQDVPAPAHTEELQWRPYTRAWFDHAVGERFDPTLVSASLRQKLDATSIWKQVLLAFVGGLILNLMPCVLPVIGLKVLSFIEQAGRNRWQALLLNVWYAAGLISVFLILASLAVFFNYGWGHLFRMAEFNIAMAVIVFAMGLSFLGVWEIPIPGFVGSGKSAQLSEREGFAGAFSKGVITTILATPCTGPFMGSALAWAVGQPPINTYAVFASVGLGMASPYLLIGAFPALVRFLPKPGAWMDTFKQIMGFVLMGTVVYIFTFLEAPYIVPTVGLLFAFWAAFWWIARTPLTADTGAKARAWLEAAVFVGLMWILLFPGIDEIAPGKYSFGGLNDVMRERFETKYAVGATDRSHWGPSGSQTVMVDFTADWCLVCKTLEATVLNTDAVRDAVVRNNVVLMKADTTHEDPPLMATIGSKAVPTLAIFPADAPNQPIVFRDTYTVGDVVEALQKAGPSKR